jgi:hypothetical protein
LVESVGCGVVGCTGGQVVGHGMNGGCGVYAAGDAV